MSVNWDKINADREWEMFHLALKDGDTAAAQKHLERARELDKLAREEGAKKE